MPANKMVQRKPSGAALVKAALLGGAVVFLVAFPNFTTGYWIRVLTGVFMYAVLAEGTNIIAGYTGYPAWGNVVFFGWGAYATTVFMKTLGWNFPMALLFGGGVLSAAYALLWGIPMLKTKGHYFVMATFALSEMSKEIVTNADSLGGSAGITLPLPDLPPQQLYSLFYYVMLGLLVATTLATWFISRHRLGFALRAIRADEGAAAVMGINTTSYKIIAWMCSAFFVGLAGGIFAYWNSFVQPSVVFDIIIAVKFFVIMLLGGLGTVLGPVIAAFGIEVLSEVIWSRAPEIHMGLLGLIMLVIVVILPKGLMQFVDEGVKLSTITANLRKGRL